MTDNFFGATDLGRQRQNNEDAFIAQQTADGRYIIACVIDGVGGYSGGEVAASIAHETIIQRLNNFGGEAIPAINDALIAANHKIWEARQANAGHSSMACVVTLALVDIETNQFYYAHLGDTRLYLFRDGSLVKISHDHSFVGFLEDSGRLSESDAMNHPKRNEIDKALGFKSDAAAANYIETGQSPFLPGDMLLLCSDGLSDLVDKATMSQIMSRHDSMEIICNELIDAANHGGGKDNITVVVVKNDKSGQKHVATRPAESAKTIMAEPVVKKKDEPQKRAAAVERPPVKTYKGIAILLFIITIGLAVVCIGEFFNKQPSTVVVPKKDTVATPKAPNPEEVKLQSIISQSKGRMLILTDSMFKGPIVIDQPILIERDSLHIKAKGSIVLQSDPGFRKPAFIVSPKVKIVVLDSLTFQNFAIAVSGHDQAVQLKDTRFVNCEVPIQNDYKLTPGKYISGNAGVPAFKTDSSSKKK